VVDRAARGSDAPGTAAMSSTHDVVTSGKEAATLARPPLVVLEPLRELLDGMQIGAGPVTAEPLGAGHSNVTYLLRRGSVSVVLRRPPRPPYAESAHDVLREGRIMTAARAAGLPVPRILAAIEDPMLLGVPFVLVEHVAGHTISSELPHELRSTENARQVGERLVAALADIHAVQVSSGELAHIGRPSGYLERQLRRFATIWAQVKTRELAAMDDLTAWLTEHRPTTAETTLVHGDFRLGNVIFAPEGPPLVAAVLDWEMATLGDPLADLGYLCATWARPGDEENPMLALSAATRFDGFLTPEDLRQQYALRTGRGVENLRWYEVLALWKAGVFLEGSYRRYRDGTTDDPYFSGLKDGVPQLAMAAYRRTLAAS
jgi:aminoglycoside phosphotransferase (APT) family kinase protein